MEDRSRFSHTPVVMSTEDDGNRSMMDIRTRNKSNVNDGENQIHTSECRRKLNNKISSI